MKTALVTGASRGIGRAIAKQLYKKGYQVAGVSRNMEHDQHIALPIQADIADINEHEKIVDQVAEKFGRIDLLVNNAGVAPLIRNDILVTTEESYDRVMNINLRGPFFLTQAVVNLMLETKDKMTNGIGTIIFITSISAVSSSPERPEYSISKAGLSMASQVFADRLTNSGITVHEVRPGIIATDMTAPVKEKYDKRIEEGLIPMQRWGQPNDIATTVVSIAEGGIPYATGTVIEVSGGMNIRHL